MSGQSPVRVLCNGAADDGLDQTQPRKVLALDYVDRGEVRPNVRLSLPRFVQNVYHLPDRLLDLLEIAAYVFCADRTISRGARDAVEYHAWSRNWEFVVKVRDHDFWSRPAVVNKLTKALVFMTGDREFAFTFQPGHATPPTSLFDGADFGVETARSRSIVLFSGGLDSLAGALHQLNNTDSKVCLVSHRSQTGTVRTQNALVSALKARYPNRVEHYPFECNLRGNRPPDESQRTRAFLFTSIAYSLANRLGTSSFMVFENGVTSLNFARRQDAMNGRTSRTTHPQTLELLRELFAEFAETPLSISAPFMDKTKAEIFDCIRSSGQAELISSAVSCSKTFRSLGNATHCGGCFQCVDRQMAAYATDSQDYDHAGLYALDFARAPRTGEDRTTIVDYIRQGREFADSNVDHFEQKWINELAAVVDFLPGMPSESEAVELVWSLCRRHGEAVQRALRTIRERYDDPYHALPPGSLLDLLSAREHLKEPVERLAASIISRLQVAIPKMFAKDSRPNNEPDLNQKINALLDGYRDDLVSEHPTVSFAGARVIPDHAFTNTDLLIESKYIRGNTPPSKASDGIAADLTKYPANAHILFVVYDPESAITDHLQFCQDFEAKGRCTVYIAR